MSDKENITLPDNNCITEWSEDTVLEILNYAFETMEVDDIKVTIHRLCKVDNIKEEVEETDWDSKIYNAHILLTKTIGDSESILYFSSNNKYNRQSFLKELEMYINNTFSNLYAYDNDTNYESLYIETDSEMDMAFFSF